MNDFVSRRLLKKNLFPTDDRPSTRRESRNREGEKEKNERNSTPLLALTESGLA